MDYSAPVPDTVERVTQAHLNEVSCDHTEDWDDVDIILQNFVKYMLNDFLGQVDTWHLALSDRYTPFHESCMRLSQIHSVSDPALPACQALTQCRPRKFGESALERD